MTKKAWIIVAVLCVAILGGLIWVSRNSQIDVSNVNINEIQAASAMSGQIADQVRGNASSKVIMIVYGDYQCPGCGATAPVIQKLVTKYGDNIGVVFRNFPLYNSHPNAFAAASAAEAAGLQGKFWEMHDYLYANQNSWNSLTGQDRTDYFVNAAKSLGINTDTFTTQLTDPNVKKKIDFDFAMGKKAGVAATPSLFIDGKNVGDQDVKDNTTLIPSDNDSSSPSVLTDADLFGRLIIEPALKAQGINVSSN